MAVDAVRNAESISDLGFLLGILDRLPNIEQYLYAAVASRMERKKFVLWSSINSMGQTGRLFPNGWVSRDAPSNSKFPHTLLKYGMEGGAPGKGRKKDRPTVFGKFSAIYSEAGTVVSSNGKG